MRFEVLNLRLKSALMIPGPGSSATWSVDPTMLPGRVIKGMANKIEITEQGHFLIHVSGRVYFVPMTSVEAAQIKLVEAPEAALSPAKKAK